MIFTLIVLGLVLAIAYFQASQGWFSAMIMTVLAVCCAAAALGTYEWVAANLLAPYWKPSYAPAIALAALFGVPMIILRLVFDRTIRRNTLLSLMVDRVGAGVCGLVTALIIVGVFALAAQMIPFEKGTILGFSRVAQAEGADAPASAEERNLWLRPDRFAASTASILSAGLFSSGKSMYQDHPDLVREVGWANSAPAGVSRYAAPNSISLAGMQLISEVHRLVPSPDPKNVPPSYEPVGPASGHEYRLVRVKLSDKARDERKSHLFTLRQFRIAGHKQGSSLLTEYHPVALRHEDAADPVPRYVRYRKLKTDRPVLDEVYQTGGSDTVEVVFELPNGFQPTMLSYKLGARTPISADAGGQAEAGRRRRGDQPAEETAAASPPAPAPTAAPPASPPSGPTRRRGGNIRGVTTQVGKSFFGDALPVELKKYRGTNVNLERGAMASGSLVAEMDDQAEGSDAPIRRLAVPDDKRLLQLNVAKLQAQSGLGRILSHAVTTVQNYYVEDDRGNRYVVVGKYAVAKVGDKEIFELQYFGGAEASLGRMGPFTRIKESDLKDDYSFVLLFLVDPGARISGFSSGGEATRADDLTAENLVAPN